MQTRRRHGVLAGMCALAAGCTTTLNATYWTPTTEGASGGRTLDIEKDLGIDVPGALVYQVVGEEAGQRLRVDYWQLKGSGAKDAPKPYSFNGMTVQQGNATSSSVDLTSLELFYEPAFIRTPDFRFRGAFGLDFVQLFMKVDDVDDLETSQVAVPGDPEGLLGLGIDYQFVFLLGGVVEYAIRPPHLKVLGRIVFFNDSLVDVTADFDGTFVATEVSLVYGAPEGRGVAAMVGYRSFAASYAYETTEVDAKLGGVFASVFLAF